MLTDLVIGRDVATGMRAHKAFLTLMQSKGAGDPDEAVLEDAVAFAGVSKFPARVKCALLSWMAWKDATTQALGVPVSDNGAAGGASIPEGTSQ
jgi:nitrogen fixation NifU-like protein